jgi:protein-S-isoprenylcysteine O-methyltransferase Ste14
MSDKAPNTIPWPPIIYVAAALLSYGLSRVIPLVSLDIAALRAIGAAMIVIAVSIDVMTFLAFRKHQTTILPNKAASHLITTGPFAFSRNPIYLSNTILLAGVGLGFDFIWMVILALPAAFVTQKLAIEREERHLAEKFGQAWADYAAKTARWLMLS